jgi:hypothetical protein
MRTAKCPREGMGPSPQGEPADGTSSDRPSGGRSRLFHASEVLQVVAAAHWSLCLVCAFFPSLAVDVRLRAASMWPSAGWRPLPPRSGGVLKSWRVGEQARPIVGKQWPGC